MFFMEIQILDSIDSVGFGHGLCLSSLSNLESCFLGFSQRCNQSRIVEDWLGCEFWQKLRRGTTCQTVFTRNWNDGITVQHVGNFTQFGGETTFFCSAKSKFSLHTINSRREIQTDFVFLVSGHRCEV